MPFRIKRVYDPPAAADGRRILVDRLWPRGISKAAAKLDDWLKEIAPSTALRLQFNHQPARFAAFSRHYRAELAINPVLAALRKLGRGKTVTLLYGARDAEVNHAVVLRQALQGRAKPAAKKPAKRRPARR